MILEDKIELMKDVLEREEVHEVVFSHKYKINWHGVNEDRLKKSIYKFFTDRIRRKFLNPEIVDCDIVNQLNEERLNNSIVGATTVNYRDWLFTLWLDVDHFEIFTKVKFSRRRI